MNRRPPIAPTQHFRNQEQADTVAQLGQGYAPISGNFSPLNPADYFDRNERIGHFPVYIAGNSGPVILCLHGAGHSGLSFACLAKIIKQWATLIAFDFRAHGANSEPERYQLDSDTLVGDTLRIFDWVRENFTDRPLVVMGHSMGGALVAKAAFAYQQRGYRVDGLIVLDVVQGSALEALPHMDNIIARRPQYFKSVEAAVQWALKTNYIKSRESARVSIPSQIERVEEKWVFVTDLARTRQFWEGWFRGMNDAFLGVDTPKQLIIAGSDRTDRQMMIAQMQGKFKHTVFFNVGHVIQEDDPIRLADEIRAFISTFRLSNDV